MSGLTPPDHSTFETMNLDYQALLALNLKGPLTLYGIRDEIAGPIPLLQIQACLYRLMEQGRIQRCPDNHLCYETATIPF